MNCFRGKQLKGFRYCKRRNTSILWEVYITHAINFGWWAEINMLLGIKVIVWENDEARIVDERLESWLHCFERQHHVRSSHLWLLILDWLKVYGWRVSALHHR